MVFFFPKHATLEHKGVLTSFLRVCPLSADPPDPSHRTPSARTLVLQCFCPLSWYVCPLVAVIFWRFLRFSLRVSQKCANQRKIATGIAKKSCSRPAWESNSEKVALKALARARFHFGGEWVVYSRILVFLVLFEGRSSIFDVFVRVL